MSVFNLINGVTSLIDPMSGLEPGATPQPKWVSALLIVFGAVTLIALGPAWSVVAALASESPPTFPSDVA